MTRVLYLSLVVCFLAGSPIGCVAHRAGLRPVAAQRDAPEKTPVIIDTDMAIDDWMAILYLLQRSDVSVKAITVTGTGEAGMFRREMTFHGIVAAPVSGSMTTLFSCPPEVTEIVPLDIGVVVPVPANGRPCMSYVMLAPPSMLTVVRVTGYPVFASRTM